MRGWQSTKLHLALITMGLISVAYGLTEFSHDLFSTYCMSLLAAAGIYSGAAVAENLKKP